MTNRNLLGTYFEQIIQPMMAFLQRYTPQTLFFYISTLLLCNTLFEGVKGELDSLVVSSVVSSDWSLLVAAISCGGCCGATINGTAAGGPTFHTFIFALVFSF
jgi:hypothetical protein